MGCMSSDVAAPVPVAPGYTGPTSGMLTLNVHEARLTRDTDTFGTMDPYCKINARMQEFKTKTASDGGVSPSWQEVFEIDVKYIGDDITFEVYTANTVSSDELIGQFRLKISALCVNKGVDDWWHINYKDKSCGQIHLSSHWKPHETEEAAEEAKKEAAAPW